MSLPDIYTTGAYLRPMEVDGKWRWVVMSFNDDSYEDGELVTPTEIGSNQDALILKEDQEYKIGGY
jgi:hypothetical protein